MEGDDDRKISSATEMQDSGKPSAAGMQTTGSKPGRKSVLPQHLIAEQNKAKIQKFKQDREQRRTQLEVQHVYLIEFVATHGKFQSMSVRTIYLYIFSCLNFLHVYFSGTETQRGGGVYYRLTRLH